jgi:thioredoxin 1
MDEIETDEELETLIKENKVVVVDFYTTWCGPCKIYSPKLDEIADGLKENADVIFRKANCEKIGKSSKSVGVKYVPTTVFYVKGTPDKNAIVGNEPEKTKERLDSIVADIDAYAETMEPLVVDEVERPKMSRKRK